MSGLDLIGNIGNEEKLAALFRGLDHLSLDMRREAFLDTLWAVNTLPQCIGPIEIVYPCQRGEFAKVFALPSGLILYPWTFDGWADG